MRLQSKVFCQYSERFQPYFYFAYQLRMLLWTMDIADIIIFPKVILHLELNAWKNNAIAL